MRSLGNFLTANWLLLLLLFGLLFMTILYFTEKPVADYQAPEVLSGALKAAPVPAGSITFCFRLDGREDMHLPHLMGAAENMFDNGDSGYNFSLFPNATGSETHGILPDGQIFAKETFLKRYGMVSFVEIKSSQTGWKPAKMYLTELNGEKVYIYTPFGDK